MSNNRDFIERWSLAGARYIKAHGGHPDISVGTMRFALQLWISLLLIVALACLISSLFGTVTQTLIALAALCILRYFSGGWHFRRLHVCIVFTAAITAIIPLLPTPGPLSLLIMNSVSLLLVLLLAPTGHGQTFTSPTHKTVFKLIAIALVLISLIFIPKIITISFLIQSFTLITMKGGDH